MKNGPSKSSSNQDFQFPLWRHHKENLREKQNLSSQTPPKNNYPANMQEPYVITAYPSNSFVVGSPPQRGGWKKKHPFGW